MSLGPFKPYVQRKVMAYQNPAPGQPRGNSADWGGDLIAQADMLTVLTSLEPYTTDTLTFEVSDDELSQGSTGPAIYALIIDPAQAGYKAIVADNVHWWMILGSKLFGQTGLQAQAMFRAMNQPGGVGCPGYWGEAPAPNTSPVWVSCPQGIMQTDPSGITTGNAPRPWNGNLKAAQAQLAAMVKAVSV